MQQVVVTNQRQCSQYNPAASSEQSQFSPVLQTQCLWACWSTCASAPKAVLQLKFSSLAPPSHGTLGSKAVMIVVKIHSPFLSLQALVPTSSPLQSPASGAPGAAAPGMRTSPDLNIMTENESRIENGAVSHGRAARPGLPAGRDNGRTEKGEVLGLGCRV